MAALPGVAPAADRNKALEAQLFKAGEGAALRGIPQAIFIENVDFLCTEYSSKEVVGKLQDLYSKYQYMQSSLAAQRASLKAKLPDIVSALETVNHLVDRREKAQDGETTEYTYQLSENIWAKGSAAPVNTACLWLGANVMLEYKLEEAVELLSTNEENARTTLKSLEEDTAFLRDQLTTTEVNIARTHNWGVKQRQKQREDGEEEPAAEAAPAAFTPAPRTGGQVKGAYTWKQEREEVEVSVRVPKDAQKADVKVTILADSLSVEHAGKVLLQGDLAGKCSPNGSTWTMTGSRVEITLEKADDKQWPGLFEATEG